MEVENFCAVMDILIDQDGDRGDHLSVTGLHGLS